MKKLGVLAFIVFCVSVNLHAQEFNNGAGKTFYYYDEESKKKVKEIYHHIQEYRIKYDKHGNSQDTVIYIKNGPYTSYHENGQLYCSGYYTREVKTGTWKFYNEKGSLVKTEEWVSGKMVSSTSH
jgi:antitoxin component YwqK of YwqJK toxin-antitoxin module